jgi:DNA invertase Pin-like site-specific DNA recombinase
VRDREPVKGRSSDRPGLQYALGRISAGEARGLVVADLGQLSHSVAGLGEILTGITCTGGRLVAIAQGIDTAEPGGRLAVNALIDVSAWERRRISDRTRAGLEAARRNGVGGPRPAVADFPDLRERILKMRADGKTLQAIADRLNAEGVPTVRGGAEWRPSSVQAATGYRRRRRASWSPASTDAGRSAAPSGETHEQVDG